MTKSKGYYTDDDKTVHPVMGTKHPHVKPISKGTKSLRIPKRQLKKKRREADLKAAKKDPSWKNRPGYSMKGKAVEEGVFQDFEMKAVEKVEAKGSMRKTYRTPGEKAPKLTPSKFAQRKELSEKLRGGTVLETHAGKGELSEHVYAKSKASEIVAVDKSEKSLKKTDKRLDRKVKHTVIPRDNVKWLENEMDPKKLRNLRLVDFDPFGSPAKSMRAFFSNFPVKRKMYVAVTDGSKIFIGYKGPDESRKWLRKEYGISVKSKGTREDQVKILDAFMKAQGRVHGFKVKPVNVGYGKQHAVYAGYEITPR